MAYYYNLDRVPYVPTREEYMEDRMRRSRNEAAEMLGSNFKKDQGLARHLRTLNHGIDGYERRRESQQSEASGHLPTTGEPSTRVADESSIPQRQPHRVEHLGWPTWSTWTPGAASSSGDIIRPSAQIYTELQNATYLQAYNISPFPYPANERSRFFPTQWDDHPDDQYVAIIEEEPSWARSSPELSATGNHGISPRDERCWARAIGTRTFSNSVALALNITGSGSYDTTSGVQNNSKITTNR